MPRFLAVLFLLLSLVPTSLSLAQEQPRILAGTATTADILKDLTGGAAEIRQLIPGGACPGHYDLRPGDLIFLEEADLLVLEAYQVDMPNMADLVRAADNSDLQTFVAPLVMDTMLPKSQLKLTLMLAEELCRVFPDLADQVDQALAERARMVRQVEEEQAGRVQGLDGAAAITSRLQAGFATWAGLTVAAAYGRPEDLTPEQYAHLLEAGQAAGVRLVLDNKQSGPGAGQGLAESLHAGQADLTSFPGAYDGEEDWASAFTGNVDRLLRAWDSVVEESGS